MAYNILAPQIIKNAPFLDYYLPPNFCPPNNPFCPQKVLFSAPKKFINFPLKIIFCPPKNFIFCPLNFIYYPLKIMFCPPKLFYLPLLWKVLPPYTCLQMNPFYLQFIHSPSPKCRKSHFQLKDFSCSLLYSTDYHRLYFTKLFFKWT